MTMRTIGIFVTAAVIIWLAVSWVAPTQDSSLPVESRSQDVGSQSEPDFIDTDGSRESPLDSDQGSDTLQSGAVLAESPSPESSNLGGDLRSGPIADDQLPRCLRVDVRVIPMLTDEEARQCREFRDARFGQNQARESTPMGRFRREVRDQDWAINAENSLYVGFAGTQGFGLSSFDVECRTTACKVTLRAPEPLELSQASTKYFNPILSGLDWRQLFDSGLLTTMDGVSGTRDGVAFIELYYSRKWD